MFFFIGCWLLFIRWRATEKLPSHTEGPAPTVCPCGYDRVGLPTLNLCPECGLPPPGPVVTTTYTRVLRKDRVPALWSCIAAAVLYAIAAPWIALPLVAWTYLRDGFRPELAWHAPLVYELHDRFAIEILTPLTIAIFMLPLFMGLPKRRAAIAWIIVRTIGFVITRFAWIN